MTDAVVNPDPYPLEMSMTSNYAITPAHSISQSITATNTEFYIAKYTSVAFSYVLNPAIHGMQTLNQYVKWVGSQAGQLYGKLYFSASGPAAAEGGSGSGSGGIGIGTGGSSGPDISHSVTSTIPMHSISYASPVSTGYVAKIGGTPISCPNGKYYISLHSTTWAGINVMPTPGQIAKVNTLFETLIGGVWGNNPIYPPYDTNNNPVTMYMENATNQTFTFSNLAWEFNYTNGDATAIRISLICYNGTIEQTTAGGPDLGAYDMKSGTLFETQANLRIMLYDGTNTKLTLTPNTANPYLVKYNFPVTNYAISRGFTSPSLSVDLYSSGAFNNNSIQLWNNDGYFSYLDTTLNGTTPLVLDLNQVTIKYMGAPITTNPTFILANLRSGTGMEWFAVVNDSSKTAIANYAKNDSSPASMAAINAFKPLGPSSSSVPFNNIVTTLMTDMSGLINYDSTAEVINHNGFNQPISSWDTSNVTNMNFMFYETDFNQPIGSWNTANVILMESTFTNATAFNQDIGLWNTSNVTYMDLMFNGAAAFNQPIGLWNTSKVVDMSSMFSGSAFNQPIGSWITTNVVNMGGMFYSCAFNQLINTSNGAWNTSNVTTMSFMFYGNVAFNQPINLWNTVKVINMDSMFQGAASFNQNINGWTVSAVTPKPPIDFSTDASVFLSANKPGANW